MRWRTRVAVAGRSCKTARNALTTSALVTSETGGLPSRGKANRSIARQPVLAVLGVAPARLHLGQDRLGGGEGGHALEAALFGQGIASGAGETTVGERLGARGGNGARRTATVFRILLLDTARGRLQPGWCDRHRDDGEHVRRIAELRRNRVRPARRRLRDFVISRSAVRVRSPAPMFTGKNAIRRSAKRPFDTLTDTLTPRSPFSPRRRQALPRVPGRDADGAFGSHRADRPSLVCRDATLLKGRRSVGTLRSSSPGTRSRSSEDSFTDAGLRRAEAAFRLSRRMQ